MKGGFCSKNIQRLKYIAGDFIAGNIAFLLFDIIRYYIFCHFHLLEISLNSYLLSTKLIYEQSIIPVALLSLYWLSGFYNEPFHKSRLQELFVTAGTAIVTGLLIYLLLLTNDQLQARKINYTLLLVAFMMFFICLYISRIIITSAALKHFKNRQWKFSTLIIGNSSRAHDTYQRLRESDFKYGYDVKGFVNIEGENQIKGDLPAYRLDKIDKLVEELGVDQLIVSPEEYYDQTVLQLLDKLIHLGIPIKIAPDTLSLITSGIRLQDIFGEPFVDLTSPVMGEFSKNVKRTFDVIASMTALIILSPWLAVVGVCVKLSSKGPVIYSQERVGRMRKPFRIYKFRSMVVNAEADGPSLTSDRDPRITKVGHIIRKYRIDELPQFWNVVKGDMSIVGPRPERAYYIRQIVKRAPYYSLVHQVKPGITSWGMVKYGYASNVDEMVSRTFYDLIYLSNMSLTVDVKIMIYTIRTILGGFGK